jgi:HKD family nuclease
MTQIIKGTVAEIIDNSTVVLSVGSESGVEVGMRFKIFSKNKIEITDPESHEKLGELDIEKFKVQVIQVFPKFSIAETYEYKTVNTGGSYNSSIWTLNKMMEEPRLVKRRKTFEIDKQEKRTINKEDSIVSVGDRVELIRGVV